MFLCLLLFCAFAAHCAAVRCPFNIPVCLPLVLPAQLPPPPIVGMEGMQSAGAQGGGEVDDLDEGENKSFKLNAQSRAALMNRLASSAGMQVSWGCRSCVVLKAESMACACVGGSEG